MIDQEDISELMKSADRILLNRLIAKVSHRDDVSPRIKEAFLENLRLFKERVRNESSFPTY